MELPLIIRPVAGLTGDMFFDLCQANSQLFMERDKDGNIIVMAPTGSDTGNYNFEFGLELGIWNRRSKLGYVFDSSSGFTLPNGAVRSPDLSWISKSKWESLLETERKKFAPICPDFVLEVRSLSDDLNDLQNKMKEYHENGCSLGWLIDRIGRKAYIYRKDGSVEIMEDIPVQLSGEDLLPGLIVETNF
ncbi:Uma2 family endonuclease [Dyadobacter sp. 3J3]|uniref:Uma2 family endonuclease n=1 Tax=Dyadobacter sp. 3J3 TaxID=2606600 RepID=UPI00135C7116|nr:Uma2 family endonuclease [Dyadobacter sp. 3J3]